MSLTDMWRSDLHAIRDKTVHQVIAFAGEGRLADDAACTREFRALLSTVPDKVLRRYAGEALSRDSADPGLALQDIVNELGRRLEFGVEPGRYRGRRGVSGHDGLWRDPQTQHTIVVEVKSSTSHVIRVEQVVSCRDQLAAQGRLDPYKSSMLIVVGREDEDTRELEAQIRGSRHAWEVRILSLPALFRMIGLKGDVYDPRSTQLLRGILVPREYTRLDGLLDIVQAVADDTSMPHQDLVSEGEEPLPGTLSQLRKQSVRATAIEFVERTLGRELDARSHTLFSSRDGEWGVCLAVSQPYVRPPFRDYWFGLQAKQDEFLRSHRNALVAYWCDDSGLLLMPYRDFSPHVPSMLQSCRGTRLLHHVVIRRTDTSTELKLRASAAPSRVDVNPYFIPTGLVARVQLGGSFSAASGYIPGSIPRDPSGMKSVTPSETSSRMPALS